ncbi:MAG: glycoside hydrolase family 24 protein [Rhodanobacteraceae bacterium]
MSARLSSSAAGGANVIAFLDMLATSELGANLLTPDTDDGYRVIVGSTPMRPILVSSYASHPRIEVRTAFGWSDAAGRYQVMASTPDRIRTDTWDWASHAAGVKDFSPESQDRVAIELVSHRGALDDIKAGRIADALAKCRQEWASLPGAGYGQRENDRERLVAIYQAAGGKLA